MAHPPSIPARERLKDPCKPSRARRDAAERRRSVLEAKTTTYGGVARKTLHVTRTFVRSLRSDRPCVVGAVSGASAGTRSSARIRRSFSTVLRRPGEGDGSDNCDCVPSFPAAFVARRRGVLHHRRRPFRPLTANAARTWRPGALVQRSGGVPRPAIAGGERALHSGAVTAPGWTRISW